jgi:hypothetical protein
MWWRALDYRVPHHIRPNKERSVNCDVAPVRSGAKGSIGSSTSPKTIDTQRHHKPNRVVGGHVARASSIAHHRPPSSADSTTAPPVPEAAFAVVPLFE